MQVLQKMQYILNTDLLPKFGVDLAVFHGLEVLQGAKEVLAVQAAVSPGPNCHFVAGVQAQSHIGLHSLQQKRKHLVIDMGCALVLVQKVGFKHGSEASFANLRPASEKERNRKRKTSNVSVSSQTRPGNHTSHAMQKGMHVTACCTASKSDLPSEKNCKNEVHSKTQHAEIGVSWVHSLPKVQLVGMQVSARHNKQVFANCTALFRSASGS